MPLTPNSPLARPLSRQGLFFDLAVFLANLFLVGALTDLVRTTEGFHPLFGVLLFAAFIAQAIGAWLKRRPLQERWTVRGRPAPGPGLLGFFYLLIMLHYCLFAAVLIFGQVSLGLWPEDPAWVRVAAGLLTLVVALLPTAMVVRAVLPGRPVPQRAATEPVDVAGAGRVSPPVPGAPWYLELLADLALYFSVVVIMAWWEGVFAETLTGAGEESVALGFVLVLLVSVPFAMFYLPPRLLLLVEDYRSRWSWLGIVTVMSPLAVRIILG